MKLMIEGTPNEIKKLLHAICNSKKFEGNKRIDMLKADLSNKVIDSKLSFSDRIRAAKELTDLESY